MLKDGSIIQAKGMRQPLRGSNESALRITLFVGDDLEDEHNTVNPEMVMRNARWWDATVIPALDPHIGRAINIGTPQAGPCLVVALHQAYAGERAAERAGTLGRTLTRDSVWFQNVVDGDFSDNPTDPATGEPVWGRNRTSVKPGTVVVPDEAAGEWVDHDDDGTVWLNRPGTLWPARLTREKLEDARFYCETTEGVGVGVFYREHCCLRVGDAEQVFQPHFFEVARQWIGRYEAGERTPEEGTLVVTHLGGVALKDELRLPACVSTGVDPAFSTATTADRTAIANVATTRSEDRGEEVWELPGVHARLHPSMLLGAVHTNHERFRPARGLIEVVQAQVFVAQQLWEQFRLRYVHDRPRTAKKGVGSRIASLEPCMNPQTAGKGSVPRFWHLPTSPLRTQLMAYPRGHDDYADAVEKAYRGRVRPTHALTDDEQGPKTLGRSPLDPMIL